jgi:cyclopropane-fatty-acyl-phospholipid synthase
VRNYPAYFGFVRDKLRPQGRLLNHCITRNDNRPRSTGKFIDRYVFPDGELLEVGRVVSAVQQTGLEVRHVESLREHYERTLRHWLANLEANWNEAVAEVGEGRARVWRLYLAGSAMSFRRGSISVHQVLAVRPTAVGASDMPLRPDWEPGASSAPPAAIDGRVPALDGLRPSPVVHS